MLKSILVILFFVSNSLGCSSSSNLEYCCEGTEGTCNYCIQAMHTCQTSIVSTSGISNCNYSNSTSITCECLKTLIDKCYNKYCVIVSPELKQLMVEKECKDIRFSSGIRVYANNFVMLFTITLMVLL